MELLAVTQPILIKVLLEIIMRIESLLFLILLNPNSNKLMTGLDVLFSLFMMAMEDLHVLIFSEINFIN
jgi:hypothetical protein